MHPDRSELTSLESTLSDVAERIMAAAGRADASRHDTLSAELWEIERLLRAAERQLSRTIDRLGD